MNAIHTVANICRALFLCRWDMAALNIAITFALFSYLERLGVKQGLLLDSELKHASLITATLVVLLLMIWGALFSSPKHADTDDADKHNIDGDH